MKKTKTEMVEDINNAFGESIDAFIASLAKASAIIEKLGVRLDPILDKPYDDNPKYACGDALEDVKCRIDITALQLASVKKRLLAKVASWDNYPGLGDEDDIARAAFVKGYLEATK